MNPVFRNIRAVLTGAVVGSIVNGSIIKISGSIIPPPEGFDLATMEGLKASMHLMQPKHFIFPFLAHAIGTFVGALLACYIAPYHKMRFAMIIGFLFFIGGLANILMLPSPIWFTILDLAGAYFPFAFIAAKLMTKKNEVQ